MSETASGGKTAPFFLGLVVGVVVTALIGGLVLLTTRSGGSAQPTTSPTATSTGSATASPSSSASATGSSAAPGSVTAEQIQAGLTSVGLSSCAIKPSPNEGKTFVATNVICSDPKDETHKVSTALITKNFEGARADLCRDVTADTSIQKYVIVSDMANFIAIGGTNVLEFPNPPSADEVAAAIGGSPITILQFCTA